MMKQRKKWGQAMRCCRRWLKLALIGICATVPISVFAGGFTVGDQGARTAGRAGATVARADDLSAIEYNPAGLAKLGQTRFHLGNRFGYVNEDFKRAPLYDWTKLDDNGVPDYVRFKTVSNETPWQLLNPMLVAATNFGLENWGFALGVYAPQGVRNQKFPYAIGDPNQDKLDGGSRYMLTKRVVNLAYYDLSVAWKYKDIFGIGASLQWVDLASVELQLVVDGTTIPGMANPVVSDYDMLVSLKGADHIGGSAIIGAWFKPKPYLEIGLSGRVIPVRLNADCKLSVKPITLTSDEPPEMTRNNRKADDVKLSFTLPVTARLGVRYIHLDGDTPLFDLELDFVYESYHMTDAYDIDGNGLNVSIIGQEVPVDHIVLPKNWRDTFSVRLGGDYNLAPDLFSIRAGAFYESAARKEEYSFVDFYAGHRLGGSLGASVMFKGFDISLSYTYIFEFPITVSETEGRVYQQVPGSRCQPPYDSTTTCHDNYLNQPAPVANAGTYVSSYHLTSLSVSYGF